ncbi:MAG: MFS transporter [Nocardioidaceae bacterium]
MTGEVLGQRHFRRFWAADTVSIFGTYVTTIALQVLVVVTLGGTAFDVGLLNGARWLPYLLLGLLVGALVDRLAHRPVLVVTDLGRGVLLLVIPLLAALDRLTLPLLLVFMVVFGTMSLFSDAAAQSFLPRVVDRSSLVAANARLDQSSAVAQTSGPVIGGALVSVLGAPVAVLVDAVSYLVSGVVIATVRVTETVSDHRDGPGLRREIADGLRWIYRHPVLAPLALSTHGWFLFNSMLGTVFVPFVLLGLHLSAFELGLTLAAAGVGGLVGSLASTRLGTTYGAGLTVLASRFAQPVAWAVIALAPQSGSDPVVVAVLAFGQLLFGLAMGAQSANEMGYWQANTPDELQGRTNATRRSANRAMIVVGAPLGGFLADAIGFRPVLWIGVVGFVVVTTALAWSPFRHARHDD